MEKNGQSVQNNEKKICLAILRGKSTGESNKQIISKVVRQGYSEREIKQILARVEEAIMGEKAPVPQPGDVILVTLGVAFAGAILWFLNNYFGYNLKRLLIWSIPLACSLTAAFYANWQRRTWVQVVALLCSLFAIVLGDFAYYVRSVHVTGVLFMAQLSASPVPMLRYFQKFLRGKMYIWFALAICTALLITGIDFKQLFRRKNVTEMRNEELDSYLLVIRRKVAGDSNDIIISQMMLQGHEETQAVKIVELVEEAMGGQNVVPSPSPVKVVFAGFVTSILCAIFWKWISNPNWLGSVPWGIGLVCSLVIVLCANGQRRNVLQALAVFFTTFSISVGFIWCYFSSNSYFVKMRGYEYSLLDCIAGIFSNYADLLLFGLAVFAGLFITGADFKRS